MDVALEHWGYLGLFVMLFLGGFGLPIPEDIPLLLSGALIQRQVLGWIPTLVVAYAGVVIADSLVYAIGRYTGTAGNRFTCWLGISSSKRLGRVQTWFDRYGTWAVAAARFLPGLRLPMFWYAGASKLSYPRFLIGDGLAAIWSVPAWIAVGYFAGPHIEPLIGKIKNVEHLVAIVIAAMVVVCAVIWWFRWRQPVAELPKA